MIYSLSFGFGRFIETIEGAKENGNGTLPIAGVLATLSEQVYLIIKNYWNWYGKNIRI
ncbi:hypothetical protein [Viridibacillus arvi]|uniref:hypothetical protein n=1 Tax=Viridibacillus arvi TaxID=263475 RepID=UPI003CFE0A41